MHDMYFKSPLDTAKKWHTILFVPYGRGGAGFSVLDVTKPLKPLHLYSIYNDIINNTEGSIASNTLNRAQQLQEQFSADNMYEQFVNAVYDFNSIKKREEEVENLLNDLL